jgi:hypothetical protein
MTPAPRARRCPALLRVGLGALVLAGGACGEAIDGDLAVRVAVRSVAPREVRTVGGDVVTLDGVNLCPALKVRVAGVEAERVTVLSAQKATVVMPARERGEVALEVVCPGDVAEVAQRVRYVASTVKLATVDRPPGYAAYADADGDGWLDGLLEREDGGVELHPGLPEGRGFDPSPLATVAELEPAFQVPQLVAADLDGDGSSDLLLFDGSSVSGGLRYRRLIRGAAGFVDAGAGRIDSAGELALLRVVDLDGDGWQDLVVAEELDATITVSVLHGDAAGAFGARQPLGVVSGTAWLSEVVELFEQTRMNGENGGLAQVDLDGDGIADLVWTEGGARWVVVLGRRDRAYVATQVALPSPAAGLFFFDADRHLDAYTVQCGGPGLLVRVWRGTAVGKFESAATDFSLASAEWSLYCAALAAKGEALEAALLPRRFDLDADGRGEFLLESAGPLSWVELSAGSTSTVVALGTGSQSPVPDHHALGDGLLPGPSGSLRIVDENGSRYLVPGPSSGSVVSSRLPPLSALTGARSCLGDFDGDGIGDLVLIGSGKANLLRGTGTGWFDGPVATFPVQGVTACAAAHFTGAAAADLVTSRAVYRNQGDGTFTEWLPTSGTTSAADVDGDGRDELLVLASANETTRRGDFQVFAADGPSGFRSLALVQNVMLQSGTMPVIADLNGDGHLDEVHCDGTKVVLQYGDGQQAGGSWGDGAEWDLPGQRCGWVRLMRGASGRFLLSGSGAVLLESAQRVTQRGTGSDGQPTARAVHTYTLTGVLPFTGVAQDQVALCDLRGRGRTDLVYAPDDLTDAADSLWVADEILGAPATFRARSEWTLEEPDLVGCADVDGDGLDDVVVTRDGRPYLVRNESY